ncbi:Transcription initiation factor TFIID subunit 8 [Quillaja saponaria]|uniref:Transcription initiation factor TFIID subunit 8 n=1 Tax=Quillaja saponaria TaxID=32244 RepID=A0AAD7VCI0_QUISA|nr:Transcription initiation factor TFIID subunit 8 [Quillaja saponaria]
MSNDSGQVRVHEQQNRQWKLGGDDFAKACAKIAVAQVCESEEFQTFQQSALETLADVAVRYIREIGKTAHYHANFSARTECNVFDIVQGLEDLGSAQGFTGASDIDHCLGTSGVVHEIIQYVNEAEQIPFAYSISQFPVIKDRKLTPSFLQKGEEPPGEHVPAWLPAFPDPDTYAQSPTWNGRVPEPHGAKILQEKDNGSGNHSLLNFQQQFIPNEFGKPSLVDLADVKAKKVSVGSNPFFSAPMQFGDKEVSSIFLPAKFSTQLNVENPVLENHLEDNCASVLETYAPAIEIIKNRFGDSEDRQEKFILNRRPNVQFKIGIGKKFLGRMLDLSPQNKEFKKTLSWSVMENEKDDKKKKAEKILKESLENPKELAEL